MADRVDAAVDGAEPPILEPVLDGPGTHAGPCQLAAGNDPVLPLGQFADDNVDISPYDGVKCDRVGFRPGVRRRRWGVGPLR